MLNQTMENEINVELQTMKNTIMRIERFLKSDKGQAKIRELRQSRQVRPADSTGPNGGHNAIRNHGNFRSPVRDQSAPTLPQEMARRRVNYAVNAGGQSTRYARMPFFAPSCAD